MVAVESKFAAAAETGMSKAVITTASKQLRLRFKLYFMLLIKSTFLLLCGDAVGELHRHIGWKSTVCIEIQGDGQRIKISR